LISKLKTKNEIENFVGGNFVMIELKEQNYFKIKFEEKYEFYDLKNFL